MKSFIIITLLFFCSLTIQAQQKRLYIANDDHTDYMWTANEAQYDSVFVKMLDYYLAEIDKTKNNAPDHQARFNCDGSFWLRTYEKYRSPAQYNRLIAAIRSGHISSPLSMLVSTYGAQPTEAVIRGMYYAGQQERRFGLRFPLVVSMENQTLPLGLSSLWAGSGAKYSWKGVCGCASKMPNNWNRRHQLYNYMGLDKSSILMKWYKMTHNNASLGGYAETRMGYKPKSTLLSLQQTIDTLTAKCNTKDYPYQSAAAFGYGWDDLQTYVSPEFVSAAQQGTNASRKVRVSNETDFFEDIENNYPSLPSESVSYGNEWDTYSVSMNETTAKVRRATEKLRTAEALSAIVSLKDKNFASQLVPARNLAWEGFGVYWEHDWTADGPVKQNERADWQIKIQQNISSYTDSLFNLSKATLGRQIRKSEKPRFYVFNPLSWVRDDVADIAYSGNSPMKVFDVSTNEEVLSQLIVKNGKPFLRIKAVKIPSVGYKVFEIREGLPKKSTNAATVSGEYISNDFYKIRLHKSGVISEIFDKIANRNIVKVIDGNYLNDLGSTNKDEGEPLVIENEGPVSVMLKAVSQNPVLHTVRLTLYKDSPRIEIQDSIQANFKDVKTWAFSFNLDKPTTRHEELGAILTAKTADNGGHYATQNARHDWLTFNHFANMSEQNYGITLSNQDCSFFKLGQSMPDSLWENSSQLNALAGGQTDGEKLGIVSQNGEKQFLYNFALTTHNQSFNAIDAMKFSLEHQNPLQTGWAEGEKSGNSSNQYSLLTITNPNVLLWSVKPSEEGIENGLITRFWNMDSKPQNPTISLSKSIKSAWQATHIETNELKMKLIKGTLKADFRPFQMKTYRLLF